MKPKKHTEIKISNDDYYAYKRKYPYGITREDRPTWNVYWDSYKLRDMSRDYLNPGHSIYTIIRFILNLIAVAMIVIFVPYLVMLSYVSMVLYKHYDNVFTGKIWLKNALKKGGFPAHFFIKFMIKESIFFKG